MTDEPKDAFSEGADAFLAGKGEDENPYDPIQDEHLSWNDGWLSAADSEVTE